MGSASSTWRSSRGGTVCRRMRDIRCASRGTEANATGCGRWPHPVPRLHREKAPEGARPDAYRRPRLAAFLAPPFLAPPFRADFLADAFRAEDFLPEDFFA